MKANANRRSSLCRFFTIVCFFVLCESYLSLDVLAYQAPLQNVITWQDGSTLYFEVFDPDLNEWQVGSQTIASSSEVKVQEGIVAWNLGWTVYDPGRHKWMTFPSDTGEVNVIIKDGIVVWMGRKHINCYAYNPEQGGWGAISMLGGGGMTYDTGVRDYAIKSGVIAMAGYNSIYDDYLLVAINGPIYTWKYILIEASNVQDLDIDDFGTITWTVNGQNHMLGYDPHNNIWYDGPTLPLASFAAQPNFSKGMVFFTDMSIGGNSWHYDFGDGTSSSERSPTHTYAQEGVYTVVQTVTGSGVINTTTHSVTIGNVPPTGTITINGGAPLTNSASVSMTVTGADVDDIVTQMRFSNIPDDPTSFDPWRNYSTNPVTWSLSPGDGTKTVGVQFRDSAGNISATYKASIILDTMPPYGCAISINAGAPYTNNVNVALALSAADAGSGISKMRFSNNPTDPNSWSPWANYATSFSPWALTSGEGQKKVGVQFKDGIGNVGAAESTILLDTTAPGASSIVINADATYTNSQNVMLAVSAQDFGSGVKSMRFRTYDLTQGSPLSAWMDYATSKLWTLLSGDGRHWVDAQFQDGSGNISSVVTDTIILDATPPADGALTAAPGDKQVTLKWSGFTDTLSGIKTYMLYFSNVFFTDITKATKIYDGPTPSYTHTNLEASTIYYYRVCAMDNAGNISSGAIANARTQGKSATLPFLLLLLD